MTIESGYRKDGRKYWRAFYVVMISQDFFQLPIPALVSPWENLHYMVVNSHNFRYNCMKSLYYSFIIFIILFDSLLQRWIPRL